MLCASPWNSRHSDIWHKPLCKGAPVQLDAFRVREDTISNYVLPVYILMALSLQTCRCACQTSSSLHIGLCVCVCVFLKLLVRIKPKRKTTESNMHDLYVARSWTWFVQRQSQYYRGITFRFLLSWTVLQQSSELKHNFHSCWLTSTALSGRCISSLLLFFPWVPLLIDLPFSWKPSLSSSLSAHPLNPSLQQSFGLMRRQVCVLHV